MATEVSISFATTKASLSGNSNFNPVDRDFSGVSLRDYCRRELAIITTVHHGRERLIIIYHKLSVAAFANNKIYQRAIETREQRARAM